MRDFVGGLRQMRRNQLLSLVVILLLSIAIGANTLIFGLVDSLLLASLPVSNPGNLFLLERHSKQQVRPGVEFSYAQVRACQLRTDLFLDVLAEQTSARPNSFPVDDGGEVHLITTQIVSPNYFSALGITATLGRVLVESDANILSPRVPAVISYQFWRSHFGGDPKILGKTLRLRRVPVVIVGVLPSNFHSLDIERAPDVRLPISAAIPLFGTPVDDPRNFRATPGFRLLARLRPNITAGAAAKSMLPQMQSIEESEIRLRNSYRSRPWPNEVLNESIEYALSYNLAWRPASSGLSQLRDQFSRTLELLMAAGGALFLIICSNITGLLLTKAEGRQKELAIRTAMGAGRFRITRQLMTENLGMTLPGAFLGAVFAYAGSPLIMTLLPAARGLDRQLGARALSAQWDARTVTFILTLALLASVVSGVLPFRLRADTDLSLELKGTSKCSSRGLRGAVPIGLQVALSTLLTVGGSLMLRSYLNLEHLNPGFDRSHIISFTLDLKRGEDSGPRATLLGEAERQIGDLAGVRSVSYAGYGLMRGVGFKSTVAPRGVILPKSTFLNVSLNSVSPTFFETLAIPLVAGRTLALTDHSTEPAPVVVNQALAALLFPDQDPIGKQVVSGTDGTKPPSNVIIGVVGNTKYRSMREGSPPIMYGLLSGSSPDA